MADQGSGAMSRRAVVAMLLACAGVVAQAAILVTDDRGRTVELSAPPARIVTLLPSLTETVCAMNACDRLVGTDRYSNWPARVNELPKLGGLEDAQLERIVALKPDLVLAGASSRVIGRLEALGVKVIAVEPKSLADTRRMMDKVAASLGKPDAGQALWHEIDRRLAAAAVRVPPALRGARVYFEVSAAPYAASASSFIGETLARLGLGNIVPASLGPFPKLNPEHVVRAQPDIVMSSQRNLAEMPKRPGWAALRAFRTGRQCGFEPMQYETMLRPGPRLGEAAERMADCLARLPQEAP
jgi:iron complex transport system substrate-binding protein